MPLTPHALQRAVESAEAEGIWLGHKLVNDGLFSGGELAALISRELKIPLTDLASCHPEPTALALADAAFCQQCYVVPMHLSHECLHLVMANPMDMGVIDFFKLKVRRRLEISVAPVDQLLTMAPSWYRTEPITLAPDPSETAVPVIFRHRSASANPDEIETPYPCGIVDMLKQVVDAKGSDLHLTAGSSPRVRIDGQLKSAPQPKLRPYHVLALVSSLMTDEQHRHFEEEKELDFSFGLENIGRFRANIFSPHCS